MQHDLLEGFSELLEINEGPCPYLDDRNCRIQLFQMKHVEGAFYEQLLDQGFRRSGLVFYQNCCVGCEACTPLRIPVDEFIMSKSQKKIWNKNSDIKIEHTPLFYDEESFELYRKYSSMRFGHEPTGKDFYYFLASSAVDSFMMRYYLDSKLIGIGWLDFLPESLSSVYYAFDPEFSKRSLGTFSVLKEIELCEEMKKKYLHMGFWVQGAKTMDYKKQFKPFELLKKGKWEITKI